MTDIGPVLHGIVLLPGILGVIGIGYLLYSDAGKVSNTSLFNVITAGLLLFTVTGELLLHTIPTMDVEELLHGVVLLSGVLGAIGTGYLLYADTIVVHYSSFFKIVTTGLLLFAVTAPIIIEFAPDAIHAIHALSAVFISIGAYRLIQQEFQADDDFDHLRTASTDDAD